MTPTIKFTSRGCLLFLLLFWLANGFERVDCALDVRQACDLVQAKYGPRP